MKKSAFPFIFIMLISVAVVSCSATNLPTQSPTREPACQGDICATTAPGLNPNIVSSGTPTPTSTTHPKSPAPSNTPPPTVELQPSDSSSGKVYHVSLQGKDGNPGTDDLPFHTISKAARIAEPGDTILIHGGIYFEHVQPSNSGLPEKYITYKNFGDGEVIIDAQNGLRSGCIELDNKSYLQFIGLTVRGANSPIGWPRAGFAIANGSHHIILDNITAYDNYIGIMAHGKRTPVSFITVQNSKTFNPETKIGNIHYGIFFYRMVYDSQILNNHAAYSLPEDSSFGIEVSTEYPGEQVNGAQRIIISGNEVDHNESQGIRTWNAVGVLISHNYLHDNGATGIQIENGSENIVIEHNLSENNAQAYEYETGIWVDGSKNVVVRNNILRYNKMGLNVKESDRVIIHDNLIYRNNRGYEHLLNTTGLIVRNYVSNISITHNTFYQNGTSDSQRGGIHFGAPEATCENIKFINNLVSETKSRIDLFQSLCANFISDYNNFFNTRSLTVKWEGENLDWPGYLAASGLDTHTLTLDPQFASPETFDFSLEPSSVLLESGTTLTTTTGPGSGTVIPVTDASYFSDGFGIGAGDDIMIGKQSAKILKIDYAQNQITVDQNITWEAGTPVSFPYSGAAPAIGVNPIE